MTQNQTAEQVREFLTGSTLSFHWWGASRSFERDGILATAETLEADHEMISARNRIIDTRHPAYRALTSLRSSIQHHWKQHTMPYVIPGMRLARREQMPDLTDSLQRLAADAAVLAGKLDLARGEIIAQARSRLGKLFREWHYPESFVELFTVEFRERSIDPPNYLAQSNAEEYKRQLMQSVRDVQVSLDKFQTECWQHLGELTRKLTTMLRLKDDPEQDVRLHQSQVSNFKSLFDRTARLNFQGTALFSTAMREAQTILAGVTVEELRDSKGLRGRVRADLEGLAGRFEQLRQGVSQPEPEAVPA